MKLYLCLYLRKRVVCTLLTGGRDVRCRTEGSGKCPLIFGGHFGQCLRVLVSVFVDEVPGKQFIDPVDRVLGDTGQNLAEVSLRAESVQLRRSDQ